MNKKEDNNDKSEKSTFILCNFYPKIQPLNSEISNINKHI